MACALFCSFDLNVSRRRISLSLFSSSSSSSCQCLPSTCRVFSLNHLERDGKGATSLIMSFLSLSVSSKSKNSIRKTNIGKNNNNNNGSIVNCLLIRNSSSSSLASCCFHLICNASARRTVGDLHLHCFANARARERKKRLTYENRLAAQIFRFRIVSRIGQ